MGLIFFFLMEIIKYEKKEVVGSCTSSFGEILSNKTIMIVEAVSVIYCVTLLTNAVYKGKVL